MAGYAPPMVVAAVLMASTAVYVAPLEPIAPANISRMATYSAKMPVVAALRATSAAAARTDTSSAPGGMTAEVVPAAAADAPARVAAPPLSDAAASAKIAGSTLTSMFSPD